jgi:flagellar motor protein MotB
MGQGDLFHSDLGPDTAQLPPRNLGYPINTFNDEIGLSINARGNRAYFASDREGAGDTDLYSFELPQEFRPVPVSYLTGRVYDSGTMRGIQALIQLIDLHTEEVVMELESHPGEGAYLISLPTDRDYAFNVSAEGYLFHSGHFSFTGFYGLQDPMRRDIALDRIVAGSSVVLHNVFYETDSHLLQEESLAELNKVLDFLEANPNIQVEISGFTDDTGSPEHNQLLSEQRARSVVEYLVGKGIEPGRLLSKGYGESNPLADNDTEEGRSRNRRTELKILKE